jgi:hypothetical protein
MRAWTPSPTASWHAPLTVDTGKWHLSKIGHKCYGDRLDVRQEISGPNGDPIVVDVLHSLLPRPEILERLPDNQVEALQSALALLAARTPTVGAAGEVIDAVATLHCH